MKIRNYILLLLFMLAGLAAHAQKVPAGINYQAVLRNDAGQAIANHDLTVKLSVVDVNTNTYYFTEKHTVRSSNVGIINVVIGEGTAELGKFRDIPWAESDLWLEVSYDLEGQGVYAVSGTTRLLSVPYAMYAGQAGSVDGQGGIAESGTTLEPDDVWQVKGNMLNSEEHFLGPVNYMPLIFKTHNQERMRITPDGELIVLGPATFQQSVQVNGSTSLGGNAQVGGNLQVNGNADIEGELRVQDRTYLYGWTDIYAPLRTFDDAMFGEDVGVVQDLSVGRDAKIYRNLEVDGELQVNGLSTLYELLVETDATVNNDLVVGNNSFFGNDIYVTRNAEIGQDLRVFGNANVDQNLAVGQNADVGNNLNVVNDGIIGNDLSVIHNTLIGNDLDVVNNAHIYNDLTVDNNTFVGVDLTVGNNATIQNDLFVINNVDVGNDVSIHGNTQIDLDLNVGGNTNIEQNLNVENSVTIQQDLTVFGQIIFPNEPTSRIVLETGWGGPDSDVDSYPVLIHGPNQGIAVVVDGSRNNDNNFISFWDSEGMQGRVEGQTYAELNNDPEFIFERALLIADVAIAAVNVGIAAAAAIVDPGNVAITATELAGATAALIGFEIFAAENLGVTYESGSGDYAEWLERESPLDDIHAGEIVGVRGGKISRTTAGASQLMVVSTSPIVLGNMPAGGNESGWEKVAFMGQVPVRVRGQVAVGDYILPSGLNDGYGRGVSPAKMELKDYGQIIGVAWSESKASRAGLVNVAIGLNTNDVAGRMQQQQQEIDGLKQQMNQVFALLGQAAPYPAAGTPAPAVTAARETGSHGAMESTASDVLPTPETMVQWIQDNAGFFTEVFAQAQAQLDSQGVKFDEYPEIAAMYADPVGYLSNLAAQGYLKQGKN